MIQSDSKRIEAIRGCRERTGLIECDEHSSYVDQYPCICLPDQLTSERINIEVFRPCEIRDSETKMAQAVGVQLHSHSFPSSLVTILPNAQAHYNITLLDRRSL